eukprot:6164236-Prymnesium_polylepis.1
MQGRPGWWRGLRTLACAPVCTGNPVRPPVATARIQEIGFDMGRVGRAREVPSRGPYRTARVPAERGE